MTNINRTILIETSHAPLARALAAGMASGGVGMFETPVRLNGQVAYYVSSGWIDAGFDAMLPEHTIQDGVATLPTQEAKDAAAAVMFAAAGGIATLAQCQDLIATSIAIDCDVESAQATFARLGLTVNQ